MARSTDGRRPRAMTAHSVYALMQLAGALCFSLVFTANVIYHVTIVKLDPLELVLVGTILEGTILLFEIPTGVLADVKSRRLSVVTGYALIGCGFVLEGSVAAFWAVALAQVIWGVGYTFTSGAAEAWVADEVGEEYAGDAYLRGAQAATLGGLLGIPLSAALGAGAIQIPILTGGALMVGLSAVLGALMREEGFRPTPTVGRTTWHSMLSTVREARRAARRRPLLVSLLAIGLFYGLYSEGYDRLWTLHILEGVGLPVRPTWAPVIWVAAIRAVGAAISLAVVGAARRRAQGARQCALGVGLLGATLLLMVALAGFGLAGGFWVAVALTWVVGSARRVIGPLYTTWFNAQVDMPRVRATLISMSGQVDAVGQVVGGPVVGALGRALSVPVALLTSAALLGPTVPLYVRALRSPEDKVCRAAAGD